MGGGGREGGGGELNTSYPKNLKRQELHIFADSNFKVDFIFKIVGLPCASRSLLVGGRKGSVHWRTIAKNNLLYSNIIIIKQTA